MVDDQDHNEYTEGVHGSFDSIDIGFSKVFVDGKLWLEGQIHNGLLQGVGKMYWPDGVTILFEGRFWWNLLNGQGKEYSKDGTLVHEGEFRAGKFLKDGRIAEKWYQGEIFDGKFHGYGREYRSNGNLWYEGEFIHGQSHGKGKEYAEAGWLKATGEFREGYLVKGRTYYCNGLIQSEGTFEFGDVLTGYGKKYHPNGALESEGYFRYNRLYGSAKQYYSTGTLMFDGVFYHGKLEGYGKYYRDE